MWCFAEHLKLSANGCTYANSILLLCSSALYWLFFDLAPSYHGVQRFDSFMSLPRLCPSCSAPDTPTLTEERCSILSFALFVPNCYPPFPFHIVVFLLESLQLSRYAEVRWDHNQASLPQKRQRTRQGLLPRASKDMSRTSINISQNRVVSGM